MASILNNILPRRSSVSRPIFGTATPGGDTAAYQVQQAVAAVPAGQGQAPSNIASLASQLGAKAAEIRSQKDQEQMVNQAQIAQQQGAQMVANRAQQIQTQGAELERGVQANQMDMAARLASVSEDAKQELYDARRQFSQDEAGLKFTNTRQLSDFARLVAKNEDEFKNYQTNLDVANDRKTQLLTVARARIQQELESQSKILNDLQNQAQDLRNNKEEQVIKQKLLTEAIAQKNSLDAYLNSIEQAMSRQAARVANNQAQNQAYGTIIGATVGTVAGGAAGGVLGSQIGSGLGGLVGSI